MTTLDLKAAFFHVIDSHRWLAASGCTWNLLMAKGDNPVRKQADELLPDVTVCVRDCVLLHARSLIDFYTKCHGSDTDILLCDFNGLSIEPARKDTLEKYKKPIEVHLLHLTAWRDWGHRQKHATIEHRPTWDKEIAPLVKSILDTLKCASEKGSKWQKPFTKLHNSCLSRYQNKCFSWPAELGEKADVMAYLKSMGI